MASLQCPPRACRRGVLPVVAATVAAVLAAAAAPRTSAQPLTTTWSTFGGNVRRNGRAVDHAPSGPNKTMVWAYYTMGAVLSSPAIGADGTVFVGSNDGNVYALAGGDGALVWRYRTGAAVVSSPAVAADGTVYVGSNDTFLYALDGASGALRWRFATNGSVASSPAIGADGTVYFGSVDGGVYAVRGADGTVVWVYNVGYPVVSSPALAVDGTVYVGADDYNVYALDGATGAVAWIRNTRYPVRAAPSVGDDGTVYAISTPLAPSGYDPILYALAPADGKAAWVFGGGHPASWIAVAKDGLLVVGSVAVYANGTQAWYASFSPDDTAGAALDVDGVAYVCSMGYHAIVAIRVDDGSVLQELTPPGTAYFSMLSLAIGLDGTLYVGVDNGGLYALR